MGVSRQREGNRPARQLYEITEKGRRSILEMRRGLRQPS